MPRVRSARAARAARFVLALAFASAASAATLPVSVPITVDGDVSDWPQALLNPTNAAWDGDGSSVACIYSSDRDCDVAGNENDLQRFAWTWDSNNFYFYIERYGTGAPWAYFEIYFDEDWDGRMETGEAVILIRANSVGTSLSAELDTYQSALPAGDPLADSQSRADGYDLPGSLQAGPALATVIPVVGGRIMEGAVTWAQLGIASNSPMYFHVGASNSANVPASLRDNMGCADGGVGNTGHRALTLTPTRDVSSGPGQTVRLLHEVCNTGNVAARIELTGISAIGYDIDFWRDADGDGWPDTFLGTDAGGDGDFSRSRDDLRPEGDSDADGRLDLGVMGPGQCAFVIVEETYPANAAGTLEMITLRASQQADPTVVAEIVDTVRIGKITLRTNQDRIGTPGGLAWLPHVVRNNTTSAERIDLSATSTRGWTYTFYLDPNRDGDPSDASLLADNDLSGAPDVQATAGEEIHIFARASIPAGAPLGIVETATIRALVQGNVRDTVIDTLQVRLAVEVMPDHTVANRDERYGAAGGSIYFAHRVVNAQGVRDAFDLVAMSSAGWPVTILADPDADGRPYDSYPLPGFTPLVSPNGGSYPLILKVDIPAGSATGSSSTITLTGTSRTDAAVTDFAFDDAFAAIVRVYEDPAHVLNVTQVAGCSTVYGQANGLPASATDYRFVWRNAAGTGVRITMVQTDSRGACEDELMLTAADVGTDWSLDIQQLQAGNWVTLDTARFDISDAVVLRSLAMSKASYQITGDTLGGNAVLENTSGSVSPVVSLRWVVKAPGGASYLRSNGLFAAFTGVESTVVDTFTIGTLASVVRPWAVASVTFPIDGTYSVELWRQPACGVPYLAGLSSFLVADDEDGDGLRSVDEIAAGTDPLDADSDDDGVLDNVDGLTDSDGDGLIDALDCDSDNDLLLDGTEMGVWDAPWATDISAGCFVPDIQPSVTTDPDNPDTDGGGVRDGVEDADQDGRRDVGETDPLDPADDVTVDSDGDGLQDVAELVIGTDPADADTDDDGVGDATEAYFDADGDGADDATECDSDGDGLSDGLERGVTLPLAATNVAAGCFVADADALTTTNPRITDSDTGGVADGAEDLNRNGSVDALESDPNDPADDDSDGDGLPNQQEAVLGSSPVDRDSDDDGVIDSAEATDLDGDTIVDAIECDTDADGLPDGLERGFIAPDADTDLAAGCFRADADPTTTTDPARADTDGGSVSDGAEDVNADGAVSPLETDPLDGIDDDSDGDGLANLAEDAAGTGRMDRDSDDDGVLDGAEAVDADADGVIDALECDTDGDTLPDGLERGVAAPDAGTDLAAGCFRADTDPLTTTDPAAADTDGGGVDDGVEDADGDGAVGATELDPNDPADDDSAPDADPDGDGLLNWQEDALGTDRGDRDTDDDGVIDSAEAVDADGDLAVDALECDTDGDGLPDGLERGVTVADADTDLAAACFIADTDPLSTTDPALADSDGGGVSDGAEDADRNGAISARERDPLAAFDDACSVAVPPDVTGLRVTHDGDVAHLNWDPVADGCTTYTAWTSASLPVLAPLAAGLNVTTIDDAVPVGPSGVTFYLIGAESPFGGPGPTGLR